MVTINLNVCLSFQVSSSRGGSEQLVLVLIGAITACFDCSSHSSRKCRNLVGANACRLKLVTCTLFLISNRGRNIVTVISAMTLSKWV